MHTIKAALGDDVRRIRATCWADLDAQVKDRFNLVAYVAKYTDEEGDLVTISSESELDDALQSKAGDTLRLAITNVVEGAKEPKANVGMVSDNGFVSVDVPKAKGEQESVKGYSGPMPRPTPRMAPPCQRSNAHHTSDEQQQSTSHTMGDSKMRSTPQPVPVPGPVPVPPHHVHTKDKSKEAMNHTPTSTPTPIPGPVPTPPSNDAARNNYSTFTNNGNDSSTHSNTGSTNNDSSSTSGGDEQQPNLYDLGMDFMNSLGVDLNAVSAEFGMNMNPNNTTAQQQRQANFTADATGANTTQNAPDFARAAGTFVEALPLMMNAFNSTMQSMNAQGSTNRNDASYTGSYANANPTGNASANPNSTARAPQMPTAADMVALAHLFGARRYE